MQTWLTELGELARGVQVGDGLEADSQMGPLNNLPQFERVQELVEDAKQSGAKVVAGGQRLGDRGYFYAPTIVADEALAEIMLPSPVQGVNLRLEGEGRVMMEKSSHR